MKKILLGTMMLAGAVAYGQGNKVVVPLTDANGTGSAAATIGIEVEGKVFATSNKSLVVEIKSAGTPDGRGFSFQMPDMFTSEKGNAVTGRFEASIQKDNVKEAFAQTPEIKLLDASNVEQASSIVAAKVTGKAHDTKLNYTLTGKTGTLEHNGAINVQAESGAETGSYNDNTVKLLVKVAGQNMN